MSSNQITTANESVGIGGNVKQAINNKSVVVGYSSLPVDTKHGPYAIHIGHNTNRILGSSSIAIGAHYGTGLSQIPNNCIVVSAMGTGTQIIPSTTGCCHIAPVRTGTGPSSLYYNPTTFEVTQYSNNTPSVQTLNTTGAIDISGTYPVTQLATTGTFTMSTGTTNMQTKLIYGSSALGYYNLSLIANVQYVSEDPRIITMVLDATNNVFYVGGLFNSIGNISANSIARYNLITNTWSALGTGVNNRVYSMVIDSARNILYIGGMFTLANGVANNYIARYDLTTNNWSTPLGIGIGGDVYTYVISLVIDTPRNMLYVGGMFDTADNVSNNNIARYDLSKNTWSTPLGAGINGPFNPYVESLVIDTPRNMLYVGGLFETANNVSNINIARYDLLNNTWGTPLVSTNVGAVYVLTIDSARNMLYIAGRNIYCYDLVNNKLSSSFEASINAELLVLSIDTNRNILYVGGFPGIINGTPFNGLAMYDLVNNKWINTKGIKTATDGYVRAILYDSIRDVTYMTYINTISNVNSILPGSGICRFSMKPTTSIVGPFTYNSTAYSSLSLATNAFLECIYKSNTLSWSINRQANIINFS